MAETLVGVGLEARRIEAPGVLDGGDVMAVGDTVYVGLGGRTDADGAEQLGEALAPTGMSVVTVPLSKVLHLKSAVTALPDGAVIGYPAALEDPSVFPGFVAAPRRPERTWSSSAAAACSWLREPPQRPSCSSSAGTNPCRWTSGSSRSSRAASRACRCACVPRAS